jgi:hypothetical protein
MENLKSNYSLKEFLKNRHPEQFSDSIEIEDSVLDRAVLEHHLSTLNKRNQELVFETYAKCICEKVICPNLLEQTGPVAGGDGKVDTQTFPVSEQIRNLWFEGINESLREERWAFAVSTQVTWKTKCQNDIRKIKNTNRGYSKVFFISNQYIKANQRSDVEDNLSKETGIDVRILDITWLLDQTFKKDLISIAIKELSIEVSKQPINPIGLNDYQRIIEIKQLNKEISTMNPSKIKPHEVGLFLDIAILSKESEKNFLETQGLFDRAIRIANSFGTKQQKFNTYYHYAWASLWWFEDFSLFNDNMKKAYELVKDSSNSVRWEHFVNLLIARTGYLRLNRTEKDTENFYTETISALEIISSDDLKPSNSLIAKTSIQVLKLTNIHSLDEAKQHLNNLLDIVKESLGLVGYPFQKIFRLIHEMDIFFGDLDEYEALLDFLIEQSGARITEVQKSMMFLKRGAKKLENNKPYGAIKLIGKSLIGLYKEESRKEICLALNIISHAYAKAGLLWASRGSLLLASSLVTNETWKTSELSPENVKSYMKIVWVELQLGRISHALIWYKLALIINANIENSVITDKEKINVDGFLSHVIFNTIKDHYHLFEKLPDALEEVGLFNSRLSALYVLGHEKLLAQEYQINIDDEYFKFLILVRDYDFKVSPPIISIFEKKWDEIESVVMGCNFSISFPKKTPFVELAESLLAAIESFFSTEIIDKVISYESSFVIDIISDDDDEIKIAHELDTSNRQLKAEIVCSRFSADMMNISGQKIIQEWMHKFILEVYLHIIVPINTDERMVDLLGEQRGLERSVSFTSSFMAQYNILGVSAISEIASLLDNKKYKRYRSIRSQAWDQDSPKSIKAYSNKNIFDSTKPEMPNSDMPFDENEVSHQNMKPYDLIKTRIWDKAGWNGTFFAQHANNLPIMALIFDNEQGAQDVFKSLISAIGTIDKSERLRVSVIKNTSKDEPYNYKIMLCENPKINEAKVFSIISRFLEITPSSDKNIENFISMYEQSKEFILTYVTSVNSKIQFPENFELFSIKKYLLILKYANKLEAKDIENIVIKNKII